MGRKVGIALLVGVGAVCLIGLIGPIRQMVFFPKNILGTVSPLVDTSEEKKKLKVIFDTKTTTAYPPNNYFPKTLIPKFETDLGINAKAYCAYDKENRELLLAKNLTEELPIASVAKIMTAVVVLERASLNFDIKVSSSAATIGEAVMGLTSGEVLTTEELLYGLMLPSGNDAAEALAQNIAGGRTAFIKSMNDKAWELGMYDTYFFNPTGLDGKNLETTSFSTCLDLVALTTFALRNPTFSKIVSTYYHELPYQENRHKFFPLYNILGLNYSYPGIKGVKPGVTEFAGETLVSYAENGDKKIIVVLLGTINSKDEVVKVYDYIFPKIGVRIPGRNI